MTPVPDNLVIQYGSFGLVVFVVVWFVTRGFPQILAVVSVSVDRVLSKMDQQDAAWRAERSLLVQAFREEQEITRKAFREELDLLRKAAREESDADRKARHEQGQLYQRSLTDLTDLGALKSALPRSQPPTTNRQ